jgi:hypothetical protein
MSTTRAQDTGDFPDVPKNHWAYHAVTHLKSLGILKGYPPTSASAAQSRDYAVLESALTDLLTYKGRDSPLPYQRSLRFDRRAVRTQIADSALLDDVYSRDTKPPDRALRPAVVEATQDMVRRTNSPDSFADYTPGHRGITLYRTRTVHARDREGVAAYQELSRRPVRAWLPGYSREGQTAVIRLVVPWSIHHAEGTFLLTETDGRWKVIWRCFVYYL